MSYYTILGVDKNATMDEIRKAYLSLAKKYHPDKFTDKEEAEKMNEKFSMIVKAYRTLLDDTKRAEYDKTLTSVSFKEKLEQSTKRLQAKMAFKNGLEHYKKGDFWRSEKYFRSAVAFFPDRALYKSYLGLSLVHQKGMGDEALKYCQEAVEKELYNSHFHVNLGIVYRILGDTKNAIKCFEEALSWNKNDSRALKELQKMKVKERMKRGLFSRFFNKGG